MSKGTTRWRAPNLYTCEANTLKWYILLIQAFFFLLPFSDEVTFHKLSIYGIGQSVVLHVKGERGEKRELLFFG